MSTGDSLVCPLECECHAIAALGEDTLMFATDYPHSESWFPKSVDAVLGWTSLSETVRRKLFWDNAVACYARYGARIGAQAT